VKPLRDTHEFTSESERRVAELLATLDPYEPNPIRRRSLTAQLAAKHQRRSLRLLKPVAALALLFAGTAAAATLTERLWSEPVDSVDQAPPQIPIARSTAPQPRPASPTRTAGPEPAEARELSAPPPANAPGKPQSTSAQRFAVATKKQPARSSEDPRPVVEALRALRKEQDPARAQSLLNDYMRSNPQGALSEEALALSIEAAHARKDPAAKSYARRYLARYPTGRQRRLAERVLAE